MGDERYAANFSDLAGVRQIGTELYESISNPEKMGNTANIALGGCTAAVALMAAHKSVQSKYRLYSALGNYLAPAFTDRHCFCSVKIIRDTDTFTTRQVEVSQILDNEKSTKVLIVTADFQVPEKDTMLEYSVKPSLPHYSAEALIPLKERRQEMVDRKILSQKVVNMHKVVFGLLSRHIEVRLHPDSVLSQNFFGMAKNIKTTQDNRSLASKVSGEFYKTKDILELQAENVAALGFIFDGGMGFIPLGHNHQFIDDARAASSLDFALRIFSNNLDLAKWHLREISTVTGDRHEHTQRAECGTTTEF